jgi:hypothetical protein
MTLGGILGILGRFSQSHTTVSHVFLSVSGWVLGVLPYVASQVDLCLGKPYLEIC